MASGDSSSSISRKKKIAKNEIKLATATFAGKFDTSYTMINNYVHDIILGIEFSGSIAHYINRQRMGYKVIIMPLNQGHTDTIFKQIEEFDLSLLTLLQMKLYSLKNLITTSQVHKLKMEVLNLMVSQYG